MPVANAVENLGRNQQRGVVEPRESGTPQGKRDA